MEVKLAIVALSILYSPPIEPTDPKPDPFSIFSALTDIKIFN